MDLTNIVGYTAAVVGTSIMIPQIIKTVRTQKAGDLSYAMLGIYMLNCTLWAIYGFLIISYPVIICNILALAIVITQSGLKVIYSKANDIKM